MLACARNAGGRLLRGNRAQKVHTSSYQAFDSPGYPHLAQLGIDVEWNQRVGQA